jgi:hypothetical protein
VAFISILRRCILGARRVEKLEQQEYQKLIATVEIVELYPETPIFIKGLRLLSPSPGLYVFDKGRAQGECDLTASCKILNLLASPHHHSPSTSTSQYASKSYNSVCRNHGARAMVHMDKDALPLPLLFLQQARHLACPTAINAIMLHLHWRCRRRNGPTLRQTRRRISNVGGRTSDLGEPQAPAIEADRRASGEVKVEQDSTVSDRLCVKARLHRRPSPGRKEWRGLKANGPWEMFGRLHLNVTRHSVDTHMAPSRRMVTRCCEVLRKFATCGKRMVGRRVVTTRVNALKTRRRPWVHVVEAGMITLLTQPPELRLVTKEVRICAVPSTDGEKLMPYKRVEADGTSHILSFLEMKCLLLGWKRLPLETKRAPSRYTT